MKIAILGAGFAGLSTAWHLLEASHEVVIFDGKGIGGGASGIATGLMHPYAGEQGKRSLLATEGMQASKQLIEAVEQHLNIKLAIHKGIIRFVQNEKQRQMFLTHSTMYGDVVPQEDGSFWIESGITVDCPLYLNGLWQMLSEKGAVMVCEDILDLTALKDFDQVVIAAGAGVKNIPALNALPLSVLKGQVLVCRERETGALLPSSSIGKGYVALTRDAKTCLVGSTYEREYLTCTPNAELAKQLLFEKIAAFFPAVAQLDIVDCRAALRAVRKGHYFPVIGKLMDSVWMIVGLGSRGLLYHAYLGRLMAEAISIDDPSLLSKPFQEPISHLL